MKSTYYILLVTFTVRVILIMVGMILLKSGNSQRNIPLNPKHL